MKQKPAKKKTVRSEPLSNSSALAPFTLFTVEPQSTESRSSNDELSPEHIIAKIRQLRYFQVHTLVELLVGLINELERRETEDLWRILSAASNRVTWPVLAGQHRTIQNKNTKHLSESNSGRDVRPILDLSEVPINPTPARLCALALIEIVEQTRFRACCSELIYNSEPEQMTVEHLERLRVLSQPRSPNALSKVVVNWSLVFKMGNFPNSPTIPRSISKWQEAALELLNVNSNGDPSSIPELCALGVNP